jgi:hypothetical protein
MRDSNPCPARTPSLSRFAGSQSSFGSKRIGGLVEAADRLNGRLRSHPVQVEMFRASAGGDFSVSDAPRALDAGEVRTALKRRRGPRHIDHLGNARLGDVRECRFEAALGMEEPLFGRGSSNSLTTSVN